VLPNVVQPLADRLDDLAPGIGPGDLDPGLCVVVVQRPRDGLVRYRQRRPDIAGVEFRRPAVALQLGLGE
jgi:hypothetical protein